MRWLGPDASAVSGLPGFTCWISFSGIQFKVMLSPYLCFISFLYLRFICSRRYFNYKLGIVHANQTSTCLDPYHSCLFIVALWSKGPDAGKGLTSWLYCVWCLLCICYFPMWYPGSGVWLYLLPDLYLLSFIQYYDNNFFHYSFS